jgi:hypothetical protein
MNQASQTTRAKIITIKYYSLIDKLKPLFPDKQIFPDLGSYDICDVIFYFSLLFTNESDLYQGNLKTLLLTQGIVLEEQVFEKVHIIVFPFIEFLKKSS